MKTSRQISKLPLNPDQNFRGNDQNLIFGEFALDSVNI